MSFFIPPFYSKFGKNVKDLHKKKYDFDHSLKTIHNTSDINIENGVIQRESGELKGYTKFNFKRFSKQGTLEGELHTDAATESKATFKFIKPYPGLNFALNLHSAIPAPTKAPSASVAVQSEQKSADASIDVAKKKEAAAKADKTKYSFVDPPASFEADYVRDNFSVSLTGRSDATVHKVDAQVAIGSDGISLGGQVLAYAKKADDQKQAGLVAGHQVKVETNFGAEYSQSDFTSSLWTDESGRFVSAGYFQKLSSFHQIGATFKYDTTGEKARQLVAGTDYRLDADTTFRAKVDLPTGVVSTALEHRLPNPNLLLSVAAQFDAPKKSAQKFGVGVTFGDF